MANESKQFCVHCGGKVSFDVTAIGLSAPCPHCEKIITLQSGKTQKAKWKLLTICSVAFLLAVVLVGLLIHRETQKANQRREAESRNHQKVQKKNASRKEMRTQLVALSLDLQKGISELEFTAKARNFLVLSQLHKDDLTTQEATIAKDLEANVDATSYFWGRFKEAPNEGTCIFVDEDDKRWLARTGLASDNQVWRAVDFKARYDAYASQVHQGFNGLPVSSATDKLNRDVAALDRIIEFGKNQIKDMDQILDEAAKKKDRYDPKYALRMILGSTRECADKLAESLSLGNSTTIK